MKKAERITKADYISENNIYIHHTIDYIPDKPFFVPTETHNRVELLLLISGGLEYIINGDVFRVNAGDLIIVDTHTSHKLKIAENCPYERIVLQFSPKYIPIFKGYNLLAIFANSSNFQHIIPNSVVKQTKIKLLLNNMCKVSNTKNPLKDVKLLSIIIELLAELHNAISQLYIYPLSPHKSSKYALLVQSITDYIHENISEKITVANISREFKLSENYIYRLFTNIVGIPLHSFIEKEKMQYAKVLILQGTPTTLVAVKLGFDYYPTFCNQYKRVFGVSPSKHFSNTNFLKT